MPGGGVAIPHLNFNPPSSLISHSTPEAGENPRFPLFQRQEVLVHLPSRRFHTPSCVIHLDFNTTKCRSPLSHTKPPFRYCEPSSFLVHLLFNAQPPIHFRFHTKPPVRYREEGKPSF